MLRLFLLLVLIGIAGSAFAGYFYGQVPGQAMLSGTFLSIGVAVMIWMRKCL